MPLLSSLDPEPILSTLFSVQGLQRRQNASILVQVEFSLPAGVDDDVFEVTLFKVFSDVNVNEASWAFHVFWNVDHVLRSGEELSVDDFSLVEDADHDECCRASRHRFS